MRVITPTTTVFASLLLSAATLTPASATIPPLDPVRLEINAPSVTDMDPSIIGTWGNSLIAVLASDASGTEPYLVSGTTATRIADINPGAGSSGSSAFAAGLGGYVFAANDGTSGREPWFTQGTEATTRRIADIINGSTASNPGSFTEVSGKVVFNVTPSAGARRQLWVTDGTEAGTTALTSIDFGVSDDGVQFVGAVPGGTKAVFNVRRFAADQDVYATDGTVSGTQIIHSFTDGVIYYMVPAGSFTYFTRVGFNINEIWRTDGTTDGTLLLKSFDGAGNPAPLGELNGKLVFNATTLAEGEELWISDGTVAGTTLLRDVNPGSASGRPYNTAIYGGRMHVSIDDGTHGRELWTTDGSASGTYLLADTLPGPGDGYAEAMAGRGGRLYYLAFEADGNTAALWSVDARTAGTQSRVTGSAAAFTEVREQAVAGGTLYSVGRMSEVVTGSGTPGTSAYALYATTIAAAPGALPAAPTASGKRKAITATWSAAYSPDRDVTGYHIRVYTRSSGGSAVKTINVSASTRTYKVTKLKARKKYWITVTPLTASGAGTASKRVKVKTK